MAPSRHQLALGTQLQGAHLLHLSRGQPWKSGVQALCPQRWQMACSRLMPKAPLTQQRMSCSRLPRRLPWRRHSSQPRHSSGRDQLLQH